MQKNCPRGGEHVWAHSMEVGKYVCVGCGVKEDALTVFYAWEEPTKRQSPAQGNFSEGKMRAKVEIVLVNYTPHDLSGLILQLPNGGGWLMREGVGRRVTERLDKLIDMMDPGNGLKVTIEVTEGE